LCIEPQYGIVSKKPKKEPVGRFDITTGLRGGKPLLLAGFSEAFTSHLVRAGRK
jgi:hypothetical protein